MLAPLPDDSERGRPRPFRENSATGLIYLEYFPELYRNLRANHTSETG